MKKESGLTMTMLVITIIVLLVLASIITYFTMKDNYLITNSENLKAIEEVQAIKDKLDEEETMKQTLTGDITAVLSQEEINTILGKYSGDLVVQTENDSKTGGKKSKLYYRSTSTKFSPKQKQELENRLGITGK